jgi:hypothetical protein
MSAFAVRIDAEQVLGLAARLDAVTGERLDRALIPVVNEVRARFDTRARRAMNAGIALSDQYVSSKMSVEPAVSAPSTSITTAGPGRPNREGLVILGHYNPKPISGRLARPGGVRIEATRGAPRELTRNTFIMRLKRGAQAGDKLGVFERVGRDGPGKRGWKHLYGVAPYSLFRFQVDKGADDLADDLQRTALAAVSDAI